MTEAPHTAPAGVALFAEAAPALVGAESDRGDVTTATLRRPPLGVRGVPPRPDAPLAAGAAAAAVTVGAAGVRPRPDGPPDAPLALAAGAPPAAATAAASAACAATAAAVVAVDSLSRARPCEPVRPLAEAKCAVFSLADAR